MDQVTDLGRRILGHLPVWVADEQATVEAQGGAQIAEVAFTTKELTERLAEDPFTRYKNGTETRPMTEAEVQHAVESLQKQGLCELAAGVAPPATEGWKMTETGYNFMQEPPTSADPPGVAVIELSGISGVTDTKVA